MADEYTNKESDDQTTLEVVAISVRNPCSLIQEAFRAFFKCLGFDQEDSSNSSEDPPTTKTDADADDGVATSTSSLVNVASTGARQRKPNPRPPINPGPPPQTNSKPST